MQELVKLASLLSPNKIIVRILFSAWHVEAKVRFSDKTLKVYIISTEPYRDYMALVSQYLARYTMPTNIVLI